MAPTDKLRLPFRWEFIPARQLHDGAVHWKWMAYSHAGELVLDSHTAFESLTECMNDARMHGYARYD